MTLMDVVAVLSIPATLAVGFLAGRLIVRSLR